MSYTRLDGNNDHAVPTMTLTVIRKMQISKGAVENFLHGKEFKLWLKNKIKHDFNFQQNSLSIIKTMTAIISVTYNK